MSSIEKITTTTKLGYGLGHIFNDMAGTMWFSYFLLFFHNVLQLNNTKAGLIIMVGQIVDGISSILVGVLSDKEYDNWNFIRVGKRKVQIHCLM